MNMPQAASASLHDPSTPAVVRLVDTAGRDGPATSHEVAGRLQAGTFFWLDVEAADDDQLVAAALEVRGTQPAAAGSGLGLAQPLTSAELRVLKLLPTSTYPQIAATLFVSCSTVKTHLRSVYHKLGAATRSEAIERAVDLRLL